MLKEKRKAYTLKLQLGIMFNYSGVPELYKKLWQDITLSPTSFLRKKYA